MLPEVSTRIPITLFRFVAGELGSAPISSHDAHACNIGAMISIPVSAITDQVAEVVLDRPLEVDTVDSTDQLPEAVRRFRSYCRDSCRCWRIDTEVVGDHLIAGRTRSGDRDAGTIETDQVGTAMHGRFADRVVLSTAVDEDAHAWITEFGVQAAVQRAGDANVVPRHKVAGDVRPADVDARPVKSDHVGAARSVPPTELLDPPIVLPEAAPSIATPTELPKVLGGTDADVVAEDRVTGGSRSCDRDTRQRAEANGIATVVVMLLIVTFIPPITLLFAMSLPVTIDRHTDLVAGSNEESGLPRTFAVIVLELDSIWIASPTKSKISSPWIVLPLEPGASTMPSPVMPSPLISISCGGNTISLRVPPGISFRSIRR